VVIRVGTVRTHVGAVRNRLMELGAHLNTPIEISARVGNGIVYGNLPLAGQADHEAYLAEALTAMRGHLASQRGYVVVESAPPAFKMQFDCWGDLGPQAEVMAALKREFDPGRVLNPGRFIHHL
jgi:FAD/FMN-containing dehydrogenase